MKRRGFSLIEALVALMLLLVALIPMAALPVAASRLYMASAAREQAALLAVQKLDELESKKFNDLSGGSQTIGGYKMVWIVGEAVDQQKEVRVSVTWNDGKSKFEVTRQVSAGAHRTST
ncbi:MAG: prepilin-type N-terminal cleavage/methylation domain-containing protein [Acetomicrobium sp.]|uniref:prepilin-type N-terminal cleavage/methylation domain-containing protein n=1 Tax=Acetomicrobium TaxID=49894 RepID=UPI0026F0D333|nr:MULTISPECIES: prepilin-type N-terminal cleavage/methylation domain-containing protein [Acetomicrobium]MDI9377618.1 prepilin-type N-terminal cleavage/methylation domain-containing protein [Synergistota bacterium]MDR9769855.1 prepilin-type N-terminal cleavage/methylation domain-containing protein [Acetomicrobium sp.]HOB10625.1 prepilin-type N-terminal cleavage/methylation domain-containing protein [Acetomicrobium sp.]HOM97654.1 prepilin-type N-terminal cleavage/methylation domain-containing pr